MMSAIQQLSHNWRQICFALSALLFLCILPISASDADTIEMRGFWTRYAKRPHTILINKQAEQKRIADENKQVRFLYNVDFTTYFDNREYKAPYQKAQTFLNFRLSPEIGVRIKDNIGGTHKLLAGVRYTQPLGGDWRNIQLDPIAFYHFQYRGFDVGMGAIPYERRISPLPDWLMYDSLTYMHPNLQGALMAWHGKNGYIEFMCDWRGSQTTYRQEMFRLILDGQYQYKWLLAGGLLHLNHKASFAAPKHEYVMDDINANAYLGVNLTRYVPMDSLAIKIGYIFGWERDRETYESFFPQGMLVELYANWWFLGLKNTFYYGDNLFPLRARNAFLNLGDPFYQSHIYNRTDIFCYLYRSSFVNFYFSWNMHYDAVHLQHQQQLIVRFNLGGLYHKEQMLRGLFDK